MTEAGLFGGGESHEVPAAPLADRMRPNSFDEFVGQEEIVGPGSLLRQAIEDDALVNMVFWGPPGSGKTTLAKLIAGYSKARFIGFSAVTSGVPQIRRTVEIARSHLTREGRKTILFIDEIHRFNKAQQDAFLPHIESGTIILIGATTENPSFELNSALLSRCRVFVLEQLTREQLEAIARRALEDAERGLAGFNPVVDDDAFDFIINFSSGDARTVLNALELAVLATHPKKDKNGRTVRHITLDIARDAMQRKHLLYDKSGEEHYNLISALHKSLRGSDVQGALYWLGRMLAGGEDPLYIARRLVRFASEDVGLADPNALRVAIDAKEAVNFLGMPEGDTALAQVTVYLACAPKSNALYRATAGVKRAIREHDALPVPFHIRNAPTSLMKDLGYGKGYGYDHNFSDHIAPQEYLPENLLGTLFYEPGEMGFEKEIAKRIAYWESLRRKVMEEAKGEKDDERGKASGAGSPPSEGKRGKRRKKRKKGK